MRRSLLAVSVAALALVSQTNALAEPANFGHFVDAEVGFISCFHDSSGLLGESCLIVTQLDGGDFDVTALRADGRTGRAVLPASSAHIDADSMTLTGDLPTFGVSTAKVSWSSEPADSHMGATYLSVTWRWISTEAAIGKGRLVLDTATGRFVELSDTFFFTGPTSGTWVARPAPSE